MGQPQAHVREEEGEAAGGIGASRTVNSDTDTIEIDKATADLLKARAAERGMSVAEFLAEFLAEVANESGPVKVDAADIAELDRRWDKVKVGAATVPHGDVVRWLDTWGTSAFRPWRER